MQFISNINWMWYYQMLNMVIYSGYTHDTRSFSIVFLYVYERVTPSYWHSRFFVTATSDNAGSHSAAFSHALTAALHVMTLGCLNFCCGLICWLEGIQYHWRVPKTPLDSPMTFSNDSFCGALAILGQNLWTNTWVPNPIDFGGFTKPRIQLPWVDITSNFGAR